MPSNVSALRYGFQLDHGEFVDAGMQAQLIMSLVNTFVVQPFPLFILLRKSRNMSFTIRRGYIAMHLAYITYEVIFFFLARIYVTMPWPGLYCEGPLCRIGLPRGVVLGFIAVTIVLIQPPFAFLIIRMHQMLVPLDSTLKLSKRVQIAMATVQLIIMALNVGGFVVFGQEPDNFRDLLQELELEYFAKRGGQLLLFGTPGNPQIFASELYFFYVTLCINFPVLCIFIFHSIHTLRQTKLTAKSTQTQRLSKTMYEVFFLQLTGVTVCHVIPLTCLMLAMRFDLSLCFADVPLALAKLLLLILFTLNSTQFCAIFILKNAGHRQLLVGYLCSIRRFVTNSKVAPAERIANKNAINSSFSTTVL